MKSLFMILGFVCSSFSASIDNLCNELPTEWYSYGDTQANVGFVEPIVDTQTDYIYIDTPSLYNNITETCVCSPAVSRFSNWKTDGLWTLSEVDGECKLTCNRCYVYFCIDKLAKTMTESIFNVTYNNDNEPTCIINAPVKTTTTITIQPTLITTTEIVEPTLTTTEVIVEPTSHNLTVNVDVEVIDANHNYTYNYTYEYPNVTLP